MIRGLDHIAIAVPELEEAIARFAEDLGLPLEGVEDVAAAQTRTAFFAVLDPDHPPHVELVSPLDGAGPIARHLDKRRPGLHHLCFRTDDLDGDAARLRERGYRFTSDVPIDGAKGVRALFLHPASTGGVLIELAQHPEVADE